MFEPFDALGDFPGEVVFFQVKASQTTQLPNFGWDVSLQTVVAYGMLEESQS